MTIGCKKIYGLWNEKEYYFKKLLVLSFFFLIIDPFKKATQLFIPKKSAVNTQHFHTISGRKLWAFVVIKAL